MAAGGQKPAFTQRISLACARHPWWTIGVWVVALVVCGAVYLTLGDVFTSSSKFLNDPDSKRAADLIQEHGGGAGSSVAQAGAAVQSLADGLDDAEGGARELAEGSRDLSSGAKELKRGLRKLAAGAGKVSSGARSASAGTAELSSGLDSAAQGAGGLSSGLQRTSGATGDFESGLSQLSRGGARQL